MTFFLFILFFLRVPLNVSEQWMQIIGAPSFDWTQSNIRIICDGNSLTLGEVGNGGGESYPTLLGEIAPYSGANVTISNFGVNAQTITAMSADAAAQIDPLFSGKHSVMIVWEGTNGITGAGYPYGDPQTEVTSLASYCAARRAAGAERIIVIGTIPRVASDHQAELDTALLQYNTLLSAQHRSFAELYIDPRLISGLNAYTAEYWGDTIHLNEAGYSRLVNQGIIPALKKLKKPRT